MKVGCIIIIIMAGRIYCHGTHHRRQDQTGPVDIRVHDRRVDHADPRTSTGGHRPGTEVHRRRYSGYRDDRFRCRRYRFLNDRRRKISKKPTGTHRPGTPGGRISAWRSAPRRKCRGRRAARSASIAPAPRRWRLAPPPRATAIAGRRACPGPAPPGPRRRRG